MSFTFKKIPPHPVLAPYIEKMWVFESSGRLPSDDMKLVVPNGNLKLTIAYSNGIIASVAATVFRAKEHSIMLTGLVDAPLTLDVAHDEKAGTIGIEFNPMGAYRFFQAGISTIKNQICGLGDLLDKTGQQLENRIADAPGVQQKITILQQFLIRQLAMHPVDPIFEFCTAAIQSTQGRITIGELEDKTGYSRRWLDMKFNEKLGASPKNLSSIIRFKNFYQAMLDGNDTVVQKNNFYDYYYDQSHFIRSFRRFTGVTPKRLAAADNHFGKKFYGE
ncbi:AraC family transcriptional regulator [Puia sp.]|jgi:AraC-like DNA-binding protein|uniref:helix-turn-helix domain-containing protein n=1 Tax=Puia sp. TaxID=2045100 RepID=UPI002F41FBF8